MDDDDSVGGDPEEGEDGKDDKGGTVTPLQIFSVFKRFALPAS